MDDSPKHSFKLPPAQQRIREKCLHPSGTYVEFPMADVESSIPARFERIVWRYPDNTAIKSGEEVVTYAELNALANRVARVIAERAGNNAVPIAVLIDKGIKQIAAMMGVLKAARSFMLLDGSLPKTRLAAMLEDCSPELTVTDGQSNSLADELMPADQPVINFDSIDPNVPSENPDIKIAPTRSHTLFILRAPRDSLRGSSIITTRCCITSCCARMRTDFVHRIEFHIFHPARQMPLPTLFSHC